jgi:DNA polymerase-1
MLVSTAEEYRVLLDKLRGGPKFTVYDLETTGLDPFGGDRLIGVALLIPDESGGPGESFYVPFRHRGDGNLPVSELCCLAPFLSDPDRVLVGFNLKFDVHFTEADRITVHNQLVDVMLAAHLANENEMTFSLKGLGDKYLGPGASGPEKELMQRLKVRGLGKDGMQYLTPAEVAPYAEQDVILTWRLALLYREELDRQGIFPLWTAANEYLAAIVAMERHGVLVDRDGCSRNMHEAREHLADIYRQMKGMVGHDFNPDSVPQLRKILGQKDTDRKALSKCKHPLAPLLVRSRSWGKAAGTFYGGFLDLMDGTNRVHPNLNQIGTISGRLSCSSPNLQALPKNSDVHRIRDLVVAPPGCVLMSWDWSQAELRLLAHYTKDEFLLGAFRENKDIHGETAARLGIQRDAAKRINFGVVYGVGADSLSEELGITKAEAKKYLDAYNRLIPGVRKLYDTVRKLGDRDRRIPMWTGRFRHYREEDETHKAMSNLIQGGVAEMMRITITRLDALMRGTAAHMVLQIHDELLFEVPRGQESGWASVIKWAMEDFEFDVPIVADGKVGYSWGRNKMESITFDRNGEPTVPDLDGAAVAETDPQRVLQFTN